MSTFDKVLRLPIPLHPIVYVSLAVTSSQSERANDDPRTFSNPDWVLSRDIQSQSIGAGLGFDPNLFVTHAVRDTQSHGAFLSAIVGGRLSRLSLSVDWLLPTPDLFQLTLDPNSPDRPATPDQAPQPEAPAAEPAATTAETSGAATTTAELRDDLPSLSAASASRAAPSFSAQLLASQRRQSPAALQGNPS